MKHKTLLSLLFCFGLIVLSCKKDNAVINDSSFNEQGTVLMQSNGAAQYSGVGYYATSEECDYGSMGADYAVRMTGSLEGCLYVYIDEYECSPSGTYREKGRELFIGTYNGEAGSFWTAYKFEAKYEGCATNGAPLGAEIFGRCQHPIVDGSGEGVFEGVSGRLDMKDNIEEGNFPYRGHFRF